MRKINNFALVAGSLSLFTSLNAFATFSTGGHSYYGSHSGGHHSSGGSWEMAAGDNDNFDVYYQSGSAFGSPYVTGDTIHFFPQDMSVSGHRWASDTWTTTILVKPKEGFDISMLDFLEYGDYSYDQAEGNEANEGIFDVSTRLYIRSKDGADMFTLGETNSAGEDTEDTWELSDSFDISDFSNGFFLTIQNKLKVKNQTRSPVSSEDSDWVSQWSDSELDSMAEFLANCNDQIQALKERWHGQGHGFGYGDFDMLSMQKLGLEIGLGGSSEVPVPASVWLFGSALGLITVVKRKK